MDKFMNEALKEAKKAYKINEVPVGCIIVKDGKIISRGYNKREKTQNPLAHAEIICINKACKKINNWRLDGCDLYVTLQPCQMCLGAIKQARISNVYYGAKTEDVPDDISTYIECRECSEILSDFFKYLRNK